jgi:hypothetical protein
MTELYSKRVLLPFVGVVQVVDLGWARALSLDGTTWSVRYHQHENKETRKGHLHYDPRVNIAIMLHIEHGQLNYRPIRKDLEPGQTKIDSQRFYEAIQSEPVPFKRADHYEYWLLDSHDGSPLALLHTCINKDEASTLNPPPVWYAIPAAELAVQDPVTQDENVYHPPVNYRLEQLVEKQAGSKPLAAWFKRTHDDEGGFPPCLIKEHWDDPESQRLCDLYIQRLAPRLLMLAGLPNQLRDRLEIAACEHAIEVDNFHRLYPEVINEELITTTRVEARLRQTNPEKKGSE